MGSPHWHRVWSGSIRGTRRDPSANTFSQDGRQILNSDTFLLHRIANAQRDRIEQRWIFFAECLEINGHTERRTDFVLPPVSPTDRAAFVVENKHVKPEKIENLLCLSHQRLLVPEQWKDRAFNWGHARMKPQKRPSFHLALVVRRLVLRISFTNHREHSSIDAGTRLDDVRDKSLLRLLVEILERFGARFLMLRQIVVGAIRHTFDFLAAEREIVFDVVSAFGIKRALLIRYVKEVQVCARYADVLIKLQALFFPVLEQLHSLLRSAKIFQLHLLELAGSECEIAGIDLIPESLPDLRDAEWQLLAGHFENVLELNEDRLCGFRPQICDRAFFGSRANMRLEHQIELPRFR